MRLYLTALLLCAWWCIEHWQLLSAQWVDPWLTYMNRLSKEAQGLFVNGVRAPQYSRRDYVVQNKKFQDWCMANNYMFSADK
jgi:hypothetical protein